MAAYGRRSRRGRRAAEAGEGGEAYRHIGELLELFSARFEAAKERRAGLDFEDLQILAARAAGADGDRRRPTAPLQPPAGRRVPGHQPPAAAADRGAARAGDAS
jgi:hypothetical protein